MSAKKDSRYSEKTAGYCFTYYLDLESLVVLMAGQVSCVRLCAVRSFTAGELTAGWVRDSRRLRCCRGDFTVTLLEMAF